MVLRLLGKKEIVGSIPTEGSVFERHSYIGLSISRCQREGTGSIPVCRTDRSSREFNHVHNNWP